MPFEREQGAKGWSRSVPPVMQAQVLAMHPDGLLSKAKAPASTCVTVDTALAWVNTMPEDSRHAIIKHSQQVDRQYQLLTAQPQLMCAWGSPVRVGVVPRPAPGGQYHMLQPTVEVIQAPTCWSCQPKFSDKEWKAMMNNERIHQLAAAGHVMPNPTAAVVMMPRVPLRFPGQLSEDGSTQDSYESSADVQVPGVTHMGLPAPAPAPRPHPLDLPAIVRTAAPADPSNGARSPVNGAAPVTSSTPYGPTPRVSAAQAHLPPGEPLIQDMHAAASDPSQPPTYLPGLVQTPSPRDLPPPPLVPPGMGPPQLVEEMQRHAPLNPPMAYTEALSPRIPELPMQEVPQPAGPPPAPTPKQARKGGFCGWLSCCSPRPLPDNALGSSQPEPGPGPQPDQLGVQTAPLPGPYQSPSASGPYYQQPGQRPPQAAFPQPQSQEQPAATANGSAFPPPTQQPTPATPEHLPAPAAIAEPSSSMQAFDIPAAPGTSQQPSPQQPAGGNPVSGAAPAATASGPRPLSTQLAQPTQPPLTASITAPAPQPTGYAPPVLPDGPAPTVALKPVSLTPLGGSTAAGALLPDLPAKSPFKPAALGEVPRGAVGLAPLVPLGPVVAAPAPAQHNGSPALTLGPSTAPVAGTSAPNAAASADVTAEALLVTAPLPAGAPPPAALTPARNSAW